MVLSAAALILLVELPVVGQLTARIQARYLMAFGWGMLTIAMFLSTQRIDLEVSFASATWLRIAQYAPMGFIFIPATMVAYLGILHCRLSRQKRSEKPSSIDAWVSQLEFVPA